MREIDILLRMMTLIRETLAHWRTHNAPRMGAALAYYAMLSFIPLLFLLILLASTLFSQELVQGTLVIEIASVIGQGAASYIDTVIHARAIQDATVVTAVVSACIIIFGALGIFGELDQDFDVLWDTPKERPVHTSVWASLVGYIYKKLVVFSAIPLLAVLLFGIIGLSIFFAILEHSVLLPAGISHLLQFFAPLVLGVALFASLYRILPSRKLPWRVLLIGALVTTILFVIGNTLIVSYIRLLLHTEIFGGGASLVGLLVWVYYSAQVFFLGVSFTYIYAKRTKAIPSRD